MLSFVARRFLASFVVVGIVAVISFFVMHIAGGDPIVAAVGEETPIERIKELQAAFGFDDPLIVQFGTWVGNLFRGDLGTSVLSKHSITSLMIPRLEPTLSIAFISGALTLLIGIPLGLLAAWNARGILDRAILVFAALGFSIPAFWMAILLVWLLAVKFSVFPAIGYTPISEGIGPWLRSIALPCLIIAVHIAPVYARVTRSTMLEVLGEDYVRTARAKGLSERVVFTRHAFTNASLPIITMVGLMFVGLITGTTIIEIVFAIPGMGRLLVTAVVDRDYPIVQSMLMITGVLFVYVNLLVDIIYAYVDPRIRY